MHTQPYLVYLTALGVGMFAPGPAMLQALALGMRHGCRPVAVVACGNICVSAAQITLVFFGLALLARHPWVFRTVSLVGAAYIAWLGLLLWRTPPRTLSRATSEKRPSLAALAGQGAAVALVNLKAWIFFGALLPPFAADGNPQPLDLLLLAAPVCLLTFGGMMAYARFGVWLAEALSSPRTARLFSRIVAVALWGGATYCAVG